MRGKKGNFLFVGLLVLGLVLLGPLTQARADYPEKPLTILEPWVPGSAGDVPMRILAELGKNDFGQPIVVQNLVGGGGTRAMLHLKQSKPDGYTIMNTWVAPQVMAPIFNPDVGYNRREFEPIILTNINPFTLVVKADHPAKDVKEFVEWAKAQTRNINVGIGAAVGLPRVVMERFLEVSGITNYNPVPFQDVETENIKGLFDGSLDFSTGSIAVEKIYGDQVRTLCLFMEERSPIAQHIPTAKELGYDLGWGFVAAGWSGLVAPQGTPNDRVNKLIEVFTKVLHTKECKKKFADAGLTMSYLPQDKFRKLWDESHELLKGPIERLLKKK